MIPRNKIIDPRYGKEKAYTELTHAHEKNPNRLQEKECLRCVFENTEKSMDDHCKSMNGTETTKSKNPAGNIQTYTFKHITIVRGKFDDVIGWSTVWQ